MIPSAIVPRPQRQRHIPIKLLDYTGLLSHLVHVTTLLSFTHSGLPAEPSIQESHSYKQESQVNEWCESMNVELVALEANST